ncbi:protein mono-ADP-ribosyltransferase PARP15-like [Xenopus laevis]|uniref:Protein mono-ADP-ribosyltransferase PARP15-like n=1 Tax=Xenopus laevis TaxID=8355 RepID=A0A8J1LWQ9_XENLA|nr:protein mono-ADP-ribosyltransferase PARP15-like [Xenopus laevis]
MYTVEIGNSIVHVKKGDITKETTDAIVNLNDHTLKHNSGVSKAILEAAGRNVYEEFSHFAKTPQGDVVVTDAGDLRCRKIIHLISVVSEEKIVAGVTGVLRECEQHNLQSVTFPAIATGNACIKAKNSLESILTGIKEHMLCTTTSCIANIYIIAYPKNVYQQYVKAFDEISVEQTYNLNIKLYGKRVTLIKGDITQQGTDCIVNLTTEHWIEIGVSLEKYYQQLEEV